MRLPIRGPSSLKGNLLDYLKSWGLMSTCHGVATIAKSERALVKAVYSLALVASVVYFGINFVKAIREFYLYETISRIETVRLSHFQFPTVTICNSNLLHPARAAPYLAAFRQSDIYLEWTRLSSSMSPKEYFEMGRNLYMVAINQSTAARYGYRLEDMLLSCYFNSRECAKGDFEYFYSTRYGNCYKFNSAGPLRDSGVAGATHGLQLELFTGFDDGAFANFGRVGGAHVFVNNYTVDPLENEGFDVASGFETSIVLDVVHEERLNFPFSNCVFNLKANDSLDSHFFRQTMAERRFYSRGHCLMLCYQSFVVQSCACNDPQAPVDPDFKRCNTINDTICFMDSAASFYQRSGPVVDCLSACPVECETYAFRASSFAADYPSVEYATALVSYRNFSAIFPANLSDYDTLKRSVLSLNVYYNEIGYTLYREVPAKTVEQLIADVGGFMAFCLGISILSAVEVLELVLEMALIAKETMAGAYTSQVNPWSKLD